MGISDFCANFPHRLERAPQGAPRFAFALGMQIVADQIRPDKTAVRLR